MFIHYCYYTFLPIFKNEYYYIFLTTTININSIYLPSTTVGNTKQYMVYTFLKNKQILI